MNRTPLRVSLLMLITAACGGSDSDESPSSTFTPMLPSILLPDANCPLVPPEAPPSTLNTFCVEPYASDVFVFGRVTGIEPALTPAYVPITDHPRDDVCEGGSVSPSIDLTLEVVDVLLGDLSATTYRIRVPYSSLSRWTPMPSIDDDNELVWLAPDAPVDHGLAEGMILGATLWLDPVIGHYTTLYSTLFELKDGVVTRQPLIGTGCGDSSAPNVEFPSDLDTLRSVLAGCSFDEAHLAVLKADRKDQVARPHSSHGAVCWSSEAY